MRVPCSAVIAPRFIIAATLLVGACAHIEVAPEEKAPGRVEVLEQAGEAGDVGWWPQVRFDHKDRPHLAFCDVSRGKLRYGTRATARWQIHDVPIEGSVGKYIALALDSHDRPGLAFYDQTKKTLWYAHGRDDGSWQFETIDHGTEIGVGSELRFDNGDAPHVFYYVPTGSFVHAWRAPGKTDSGKWTTQIVGPAAPGYSIRAGVAARPEGFWLSFAGIDAGATRLMLAQPGPDGFTVRPLQQLDRGDGWWSYLGFDDSQPFVVYSNPANASSRSPGSMTAAPSGRLLPRASAVLLRPRVPGTSS